MTPTVANAWAKTIVHERWNAKVQRLGALIEPLIGRLVEDLGGIGDGSYLTVNCLMGTLIEQADLTDQVKLVWYWYHSLDSRLYSVVIYDANEKQLMRIAKTC